ncbi:uncharacterized protein B0P05DRAFT_558469 [Gilbertella persicaria]|uniref:uncharacterized protein n=1 Tax=Gilbertella persicaria TaxID=101096 RepID=UPI002220FC79|nr:uncharacterized protein B0P05DRAFT_558469 [Gilbertella persicaria]KAI8059399.1 hypothetical protein B0P05DRAFT_558469 [Gilbertella persicaria]
MDKLLSQAQVKIHVESESLIMYGSSTESAGCVLRGVMSLRLPETTKIKSITLEFSGKSTISWIEDTSNSPDRLFREEKSIMNHTWTFLARQTKIHSVPAGNYSYEFELPLPGDLPESTYVANFYTIQYQLRATVERSTFLPNISTRKSIHISRQLLPLTDEFLEPIAITNQWANKLDYEISLPTKIYTHSDTISVSIRFIPLISTLKVRHLTCIFKEYMVCKNQTLFRSRPRAQGRILFSTRDEKFGRVTHTTGEWTKTQLIPLPSSPYELQCDIQNDAIRIRHKIKFILSLINTDGHVSELRASLPVTICAVNQTGLPAYEETWRSLPYDPASMIALLYPSSSSRIPEEPSLPSYSSIAQEVSLYSPPNYDELTCVR